MRARFHGWSGWILAALTVLPFVTVTAGSALAQAPSLEGTPLSALLASEQELVAPVDQPVDGWLPEFNSYFGGGFLRTDDPSAYDFERVAVAAGGDRVFVVSQDPAALDGVAVYAAPGMSRIATFGAADLQHPGGIAYYRGQVFVTDTNKIVVFDAVTGAKLRTFGLPVDVSLDSAPSDPTLNTGLLAGGIDVAWNEIWVTMEGRSRYGPAGTVVVLDARTGEAKAASVHLGQYPCQVNPLGVSFSGDCSAKYQGLNGHCSLSGTTPVHVVLAVAVCGFVAVADGANTSATWWDLGAAPELSSVVAGCRTIHRQAPTATSSITLSTALVTDPAADGCAGGEHQDGIDVVWGMRWLISLNGSFPDNNKAGTVREWAIRDDGTFEPKRQWSPKDSTGPDVHRDVAYVNRETTLDWSGDLTRSDWMRGTRCVDYIATDADIYVVGWRGERWVELARHLVDVKLAIDGTTIASSTLPKDTLCANLETIQSGRHVLTLTASLTDGRTVQQTNSPFKVDRTAPYGEVLGVGRFVRGTVNVTGTLEDDHAGPRERQLQVAPSGGSFTNVCGLQSASDGQDYACSWDTTQVPDGSYTVRAHMRDLLSPAFGGPNTGDKDVTTTVDNTPPAISLSGLLYNDRDGTETHPGDNLPLAIDITDGGSGATGAQVLVDGLQVDDATQPCANGGCPLHQDFTLDTAGLTDGEHTIEIDATDGLGLRSTQSFTIDFEAIGTPPESSQPDPIDDSGTKAVAVSAPATKSTIDNYLPCTSASQPANFSVWSAGPTFEGLGVTKVLRECGAPAPVGGPTRYNAVTYIYGNCGPVDPNEGTCSFALQISSFPACERTRASYDSGPAEFSMPYTPTTLHGTDAAIVGDGHHVDVYTGDATVSIFGNDMAQVKRAADALRQEPAAQPPAVPLPQIAPPSLPAPLPGSLAGKLPCAGASAPVIPPAEPASRLARANYGPQQYGGAVYSTAPGHGCDVSAKVDPVGVIFHGPAASHRAVASGPENGSNSGAAAFHTNPAWAYSLGNSSQDYYSHGHCGGANAQVASSRWGSSAERYHMRLWGQPDESYVTAGTPHMDTRLGCSKDYADNRHYELPTGGTGQGYDYARERLGRGFLTGHHTVLRKPWNNSEHIGQCGGKFIAHSNGDVLIITMTKR